MVTHQTFVARKACEKIWESNRFSLTRRMEVCLFLTRVAKIAQSSHQKLAALTTARDQKRMLTARVGTMMSTTAQPIIPGPLFA